MKKQLFSLMMAFALVVGLSVSAFAQFGVGTQDAPQMQFPGASKTFTLTNAIPASGSRAWLVYDETEGEDADASDCTVLTGTAASFTTQWASTATGTYSIRVTDTNSQGCATTRYFYVTIANFDVDVYACTSAGVRIPVGDGALAGCGQNAAYNAFDNELTHIGAGTVTFNDPAPVDGELGDVEGTSPYNRRYVRVDISSTGANQIDLSTIDYWWQFDFTVTGDVNTDYVAVSTTNAEATATTAAGGGNVIVTPIGVANDGGMQTSVILALDFYVRWGSDVSFAVNVASANTRLSDDGITYNDGNEPTYNYYGTAADANNPQSNVSAVQTFYGSPATSVISSGN